MEKSFLTSRIAAFGTARAVLVGIALMTASAGTPFAAGKVGEMAGDFINLKGLDDKTYNLKDYQGKVVLITTVQYNCGGCVANAPVLGALAMKFQGKAFQAFGPDINKGTKEQLGTFAKKLKENAPTVDFPLLMGLPVNEIKDSVTGSTVWGTKWIPYDALRDVFFVIDHTGKIAARIEGNRGNNMGPTKFKALEDSIAAALARVPTTAIAISGSDLCLRACKRGAQFQIDLDPRRMNLSGNVTLRILDPQGRVVRNLDWNPTLAGSAASAGGRQAIWDGMDSRGRAVAWGTYFLNATSPAASVSLLLSWVP